MPKYSILMRINGPDQGRLEAAISSLTQQSVTDWELVVIGTPKDLVDVGPFTDPRIRTALGGPDETLPYAANRLLAGLGTWVGFLGQDDRLASDALVQLDLALLAANEPRVLFTDEESCNWFGQVSMRFRKGELNPLRLRSQEYLRDLVVIDRATLQELGGFNPTTSTCPTHDFYLRVLEVHGAGVFCHIPHRLYQRFRDHRDPLPRVEHDLEAVHQHLARQQLPAEVRQLNGEAHIEYRHETHPWVTAVIVVGDDLPAGQRRILRSQGTPVYRPSTFQILHLGTSTAAEIEYRALASQLKMAYRRSQDSVPVALNQEALRIDTELLLFLQGEAVNSRWLHRLVDHVRLPGAGAVGPRIFAGSRLHQPGILGHAYEGWDWNTAGRFNVLSVPHQISAVSPACLLVDTRRFLQYGMFNPAFPTLYGMDLCLRLDQAGFANMLVPTSRVEVVDSIIPAAETALLRDAWPEWTDRFGLHLPLHQ